MCDTTKTMGDMELQPKEMEASIEKKRSMALLSIVGCLLIIGCASSQLDVDPDYRWVGGRTYTANIKKLQAYSKCELPQPNGGEFTVVDSSIEDLRRPLKMVVCYTGVEGDNNSAGQDWELYLYHVVSNAEKGVEVVTTVCKSDYGRFEPILRNEVIKYVKESNAEECKKWRSWAVCTNYNELAKQSPCITCGREFYDMVKVDVLDQIYDDTRRFCGSGDILQNFAEHIWRLQKLGLMEIGVNPKMAVSSTDDQIYANCVCDALNNPFARLRYIAFSALMGAQAGPVAFDIVKEVSAKVVTKKTALKKKLDDEAELARKERERLAEQRRIAEEKRRREEAAALKRKQAEDKILLDQLDESVVTWKHENAKAISKIVNSDDPLSSFLAFVKGNGIPAFKVPSRLQLAESKRMAKEMVLRWNRWQEIKVDDFTSTDPGVRAKAIYNLRPCCNCLDEKIWDAIIKHCAVEENRVFDKSFYKKEIPVGGKAVDLTLSYEGLRPSCFKIGARYALIHARNFVGYNGFKGAELGSCFDRNLGAYNVSLNTGIYKDSFDYENIIVSGIGDEITTGSSLPVNMEVVYKGTIEGHNRFDNVVRLRHFEVFDESKLNLAEVSDFEIDNEIDNCHKGVKIDEQQFFFLFAEDLRNMSRIGDHSVGNLYIFRKKHKADENTDMKQVLV